MSTMVEPVCRFYVKSYSGTTNLYEIADLISSRELYDIVREQEGLPDDGSWYLRNRRGLVEPQRHGNYASIASEETLFVTPRMLGGKGGFGTELRLQSKKKGPKAVTNFGACRDLSGRRLRHVNDALLLQKWKEAKESGEKYDPTKEKTQSGIENWFLATPSWADVKKKSPGMALIQGKRKTTLCPQWLEARRGGKKPPPHSPPWWGCPHGRGCRFAHGEGDMESTSLLKYKKEKRAEQKQKEWSERDAYVSSVTESYYKEDDLAAMVSQGLAQANKRRKIEKSSSSGDKVEVEVETAEGDGEEVTFEGDFPLLCVNGDVDVTGLLSDSAEGAGGASIDRYQCEGVSSFGTVIAPGLELRSGSYYYEVTLLTAGVMQIGWATSSFLEQAKGKGAGDGCGDDAHSWGYCGNRAMLWHNDGQREHTSLHQCGDKRLDKWEAGQVVGCSLSVGSAEHDPKNKAHFSMNFTLDGKPLDPQLFTDTIPLPIGQGFYPALSLEEGERVEVNLGTQPFLYNDTRRTAVRDAFREKGDDEETGDLASVPPPRIPPTPDPLTAIDLEEDIHTSAEEIQALYSADHLKWELQRRGLKAGGTHADRAQRLFSVRGVKQGDVDKKLLARKK